MSDPVIGVAGIGVLLLLIVLRVPIGVAMILVSAAGITALLDFQTMTGLLRSLPYDFSASWALSTVPSFLAMGYICYHARLTTGLFRLAKLWLSALPGGMAIATIFASAGFATMSGSSVASAAAMGRIAIPEMVRGGYSASLAGGTVAAAGTLGALIPPSILLILYGIFVQQPIGRLFLGGIGMGLLTVVAYVAVVYVWAKLRPGDAPQVTVGDVRRERREALKETTPALLLVVVTFGGLFSGIFTATEAGAVGAFAAACIGLFSRTLSWPGLLNALEEAVSTTCVIFIISIGANLLVRFLALSGADQLISDWILAFDPTSAQFLIIVAVIYLLLGMFLEPVGCMLLTLPILFPVVVALDIDPIWFGIILLKLLEIGMLTPPVGMNVFVIKSVAGDLCTLGQLFKAVTFFILADAVVILIAVWFPQVIMALT